MGNSRSFTREQLLARWEDPEFRTKMSESHKNSWTPERRIAMSVRMKGNQHTLGKKLPISHSLKQSKRMLGNKNLLGHVHTAESRAKMSAKRKGVPKSKSHSENLQRHLANIHRPTSIEIILKEILIQKYSNFEIVSEFSMPPFTYDFAVPDFNLLFEADGEYWHSNNWAKNRDRLKDNHAIKLGWYVIRYTGNELKEWAKNALSSSH